MLSRRKPNTSFVKNKKKEQTYLTPIVAAISGALGYFFSPSSYTVKGPVEWRMCFTPGESCLPLILESLQKAKRTIDVQAYTLTSRTIAVALVAARKRGIRVRVLLDKSQKLNPYGQLPLLQKGRLDIRIDYRPAIAHNKVMIIDRYKTLTGSYNWTEGAERRNAENLLLISNKSIARRYLANFEKRWGVSIPVKKLSSFKTSKFLSFLKR